MPSGVYERTIPVSEKTRLKLSLLAKINSFGHKSHKAWNKGLTKDHPLVSKNIKNLITFCKEKKGKTIKEMYGESKAKNIQEKQWKNGRVAWNKGLTKFTDSRIYKLSLQAKSKIGCYNPRTGKTYVEIYGSVERANLEASKRIPKILSKVCQRPNKFEIKCGEQLEKQFPGKFKYVGNGSTLIGGKSPDFISEELGIVVLCNGIYWHLFRQGLTLIDKNIVELKESAPFRNSGYEVWFIWEDVI